VTDARWSSRGRARVASIAVLAAAVNLLVVLVASDVADSDHQAWSDPISYFGSAGAPYPSAFNASLALVGLTTLGWSVTCWWSGRRLLATATTIAGVTLVLLVLWPIDCSPVDDLCEVLIRGRVVSGRHLAHSYVALIFFIALFAVTVIAGRQTRRSSSGAWRRAVASVFIVLSVAALLVIVGRPFGGGSGAAEILAVVVAVGAVVVSPTSGTAFDRQA
jgi:hypothetical membrane protein